MELAIYIKNLLYNQDQVVIPGLGTLRTRYKPAEVHASEKVITPPSKYLVFDVKSDPSDTLLAEFIAKEKGINTADAKEFVTAQVSDLKKKLTSGETIFFEGIGYFSEQNNVVRFDREPGVNFLTDSYGLAQVGYRLSEAPIETKSPETFETFTDKKRRFVPVLMTLIVLIIIGAAIVTFLFFPGILRIKKNPQPIAVVQEEPDTTTSVENDTIRPDSLNEVFDSTTDKRRALAIPEQKTEKKEAVKKENATPAPKAEVNFFIIAGSFTTYERATLLSNQLKKEGFKPEVVKFDENLYRVSLGAFEKKENAVAELQRIRAAKGKDAAWLLAK